MADDSLWSRRLGAFLAFAFGIAWAAAAVIYATGGLTDSPTLTSVGGAQLTLAAVLLPTVYMFAPGVANVLTRWVTDEGWSDLRLDPRVRESLRYYAVAWFAPTLLSALGAGLFFLVFPRYFDPAMSAFGEAVSGAAGQPVDPAVLAVVQVVAAVTVAPLVNAVFAFGEEFGWRAYLLPNMLPVGRRRAVLGHGVVWGVWHWPLILMGYEYGFGYPGAPWSGLVVFLAFAVAVGTFLAWLTLRTDSVWPASVGHGAVNASAGLGALFVQGSPNPILGPLPVGIVAGVPWLLVAAALLWHEGALRPRGEGRTADATTSGGGE